MVWDRSLSIRRSRRTGWKICLGAALGAALFLWGLAQQSYWALALPVAAGVLAALSLAFYIGYTILTVRGIPAAAEHYDTRAAKATALAICAASVVLGCVFLAGVIAQSYWALALPVTLAVLGLLGMVFWIGLAIVLQRTTLSQARSSAAAVPGAEPGAGGGTLPGGASGTLPAAEPSAKPGAKPGVGSGKLPGAKPGAPAP